MAHDSEPLVAAFLLFPQVTQLDLTGPVQVVSKWPHTRVELVAASREPVTTDAGFAIVPTSTFADVGDVGVLCVPGGDGAFLAAQDDETLEFVRRAAVRARWVTSVCTGAFVLAAAGVLSGRRAATHWASRRLLERLGVEVVAERVVFDGNIATGGGVTAGIDFAFALTEAEFGEGLARRLQLQLEYDPAPSFDAGSPQKADPALVQAIREYTENSRAAIVERIAARIPTG